MARANGPLNRPLICEPCNLIQFSSYSEFRRHHLRHIRQPYVSLTRLSQTEIEELGGGSHRISSGESTESTPVPPIKLSVVKQTGSERFLIIKKKDISWSNNSRWAVVPRGATEGEEAVLEDLVSRVSVTRSRRAATRGNARSKEMNPQTLKKDPVRGRGKGRTSEEVQHESRGGVEGLSMSVRSQGSTSEYSRSLPATESRPTSSGLVIFNNKKSIDLNDLRKLKNQSSDSETKVVDNSKLLEKLLNASNISVETRPKSTKSPKILIREPYVKLERIDSGELEPLASGSTPTKKPKIEDNDGNSNLSNITNTPINQVVGEPARTRMAKENTSSAGQARRPRTKYSIRVRARDQSSQEVDANDSEVKVDTAGRITAYRKSSGSEMSAEHVGNREDTRMSATDLSQMPSTSSGVPLHMDLSACLQPSPQATTNNSNSGGDSAGISSTLITPDLKNQDGNIPTFANIPVRSENFTESNNFVAEAEEVRESFCESLTNDGHDSRRGPQQPNEQASFWSNLQRASSQNANNHQDAVMGHNNVSNNEAINVNFLRNFLAEHQVQHGPIPSDNSEFVSLERLAAQHQQSRYNVNNADVTTPMEQLTQQVHRMSNPPPQINIIAQHHLQAPPPLHPAGVPLAQHSAPYDALGHMQQSMGPPPLFQGFTMFPNQAFQQQGSTQQIIPRPPALQQCPQIQVGAFQSLAAPQPTRPKARLAKRSMPVPLPPPELLFSKQRRSEPAIKGKSQPSKDKGKGKASPKPATKPETKPETKPATKPTSKPASKTSNSASRAPTKKMDPQMVARILAARGITVTPSTSRHASGGQKTQQKNVSTGPVLNISSAISITPSVHNKTNLGKKIGNNASDLRRHSGPIINIDVGRPKRCATVDLTDDDDEPQLDINAPGPSVNRFLCNQCGQKFPTASSLELHQATHRAPEPTSMRCDYCSLEFSTAEDLERHRMDNHKYRGRSQNWVIPVVDLDFPGAEDRLVEHGITNFIPLTLDDDEGTYAIPIIQQDAPRRHRDLLGVSNVIVLGQIRSLFARHEDSE